MQDAATRAQVSSIVHGQVVEVRQAREARGLAPEWPTPALHQRLQRDALSPEPCASPPNLVERLCSLKQQQRQQRSHDLHTSGVACVQPSRDCAQAHDWKLHVRPQRRSGPAVAEHTPRLYVRLKRRDFLVFEDGPRSLPKMLAKKKLSWRGPCKCRSLCYILMSD